MRRRRGADCLTLAGEAGSPTHLKLTAIAFALLSLTLVAAAAWEWMSRRADHAADPSERHGWHGRLILFAISVLVLGSLCAVAAAAGWSRDRALWVGLGAYLALLTLTRPWWFWEDWKARGLRDLIGDAATAAVYLALAGAMVWVGLYTDWTFGRR